MPLGDPEDSPTVAHIPASRAAAVRSLALLVIGPTETKTVPVADGQVLAVGRSAESDVQVDDAKLSRRHVTLRVGPKIEVIDLGSLNGTAVRDARIEANRAMEVAIGEPITIGDTLLVFQRRIDAANPWHVHGHGYFEERLEEECLRSSIGARTNTFTLIRVRLEGPVSTLGRSETPLSEALGGWLEPRSVAARYAPNEYEILLLGASAEQGDLRGADLAMRLARAGLKFRVGMAVFPRDGRTPASLIEATSRQLDDVHVPAGEALPIGAIERMDRVIRRVAGGSINVLVLGETGVGKEILARRIHELSPRAKVRMLSINCAAISDSLLESELFGHEKGAFTGAVAAKMGLLESANGGSVFLDEVGEMPLGLQAKMLRVLEQREVMRVGALRAHPIDVRFIAATNRELEAEVAAGRFRQDLYFRLNGIALSLPPLRERVEEIEPLARVFLQESCRAMGRDLLDISPTALEVLQTYSWPGNIRELRNIIERAALLCTGGEILRAHLPIEKMGRPPSIPVPPATRPTLAAPSQRRNDDHSSDTLPVRQTTPGWSTEEERRRVADALDQCAGNQSQAAKLLGVSRGTLIKRIEEFGIRRPRKHE